MYVILNWLEAQRVWTVIETSGRGLVWLCFYFIFKEKRMRKTKEWLIEDIHLFRNHYLQCDKKERIRFRKELERYESRFDSKQEFLGWYLRVVN